MEVNIFLRFFRKGPSILFGFQLTPSVLLTEEVVRQSLTNLTLLVFLTLWGAAINVTERSFRLGTVTWECLLHSLFSVTLALRAPKLLEFPVARKARWARG